MAYLTLGKRRSGDLAGSFDGQLSDQAPSKADFSRTRSCCFIIFKQLITLYGVFLKT